MGAQRHTLPHRAASVQPLPGRKETVRATVAEQFWREVLDIRRPLNHVERHRPRHQRGRPGSGRAIQQKLKRLR
jgi:hypothetical protein